ncbi:MAG: hypothetical protein A2X96_01130 [Syntrophobacterales bacterium GWC2_56_13]|nr:MAG: hypothetical protein A2X96_01130 [Syntrophobacterales bacterium GWC2_56_13]OHE21390.1 MAG: hypothetical protein A2X95_02500 [Syntrophobacterales bacterium GWF2_56_9]
MISKRLIVFLIVLALLAAGPLQLSATNSASREYTLKAVFLYNIALFVEWPEGAFTSEQSPLTICVLGNNPFGEALDSLSRQTVKNRKLAVRQINRVEEAAGCQILFVSATEKMRLDDILTAVRNWNVLTISDLDNFAYAGGIVQLITLEDKIRFEINLKSAQRAKLKISSKLLKLARDIIE